MVIQIAELLGVKTFPMRAWLDPKKLAAYALTASDVSTALERTIILRELGTTKAHVQVNLTASPVCIQSQNSRFNYPQATGRRNYSAERCGQCHLGADGLRSSVSFDGNTAVYYWLQIAPAPIA